MRIFLRLLAGILFLLLIPCGACAAPDLDRGQLRALWAALGAVPALESVYADPPHASAPYRAGALRAEVLEDALGYLNLLRAVAGLAPVEMTGALNELAQAGALLQAALGDVSHAPAQPADMPDALYRRGYEASAASNLARFNWWSDDLLREALLCFALDDAGENLMTLGHRRWLLYPYMRDTGFGLAGDARGYASALLYVMDDSNPDARYDLIAWPAEGAFPAEWMSEQMAWSISPNPARYDLQQSRPRIILTEERSGARFEFSEQSNANPTSGAFFRMAGGRYGDGPVYIFRPALDMCPALADGYCQNQIYTVRLAGMVAHDGQALPEIAYEVRIVSLSPIDPADVELSAPSDTLCVGQRMRLCAQVVPSWADDLRVVYESSDPAVAEVDAQGLVTARAAGQTTLRARSANGREDALPLTVVPSAPGG